MPFSTLNMSTRLGDSPGNVKENMVRVARAFDFSPERLTTVNQVHGIIVEHIRDEGGERYSNIESDGLVTAEPGTAIGILTADCVPVLLADPVKNVVAAAHAGWRGTALGITARAVGSMTECFHSDPAGIHAAIGPRIGPCCYTVGENVLEAFAEKFGPEPACFSRRGDGTLTLDLAAANKVLLVRAGLREENIDVLDGVCTSCNPDLFFSHRRDGAEGPTGRQLSFIVISPREEEQP